MEDREELKLEIAENENEESSDPSPETDPISGAASDQNDKSIM